MFYSIYTNCNQYNIIIIFSLYSSFLFRLKVKIRYLVLFNPPTWAIYVAISGVCITCRILYSALDYKDWPNTYIYLHSELFYFSFSFAVFWRSGSVVLVGYQCSFLLCRIPYPSTTTTTTGSK